MNPQKHYQALLEDSPEFTAPEDLDAFLSTVYSYHRAGGLVPAALESVLDVVQMLFTGALLTFLLCWIDWGALDGATSLGQAVRFQGVATWFGVLLASFGAYVVWFALASGMRIVRLAGVRDFYTRVLRIDDARLRSVAWSVVLERVIRVPRLCRTRQSVSALDVANRVMREDNYVIAFVNKGLLPLPHWAAQLVGGTQLLATQALEFAFRAVLLPLLMHYAYTSGSAAAAAATATARRSAAMRQAAASIRARARLAAVLCVLVSPFVTLYLFVYTAVNYVAALSTQPAVLAARQWTPLARWRYREFNELPHEFRKRLNRAYEPAQRYCDSFPAYWLAVPARFLSFVLSGFVFALVVLSVVDDKLMLDTEIAFGRAGVWWLTVLGSALALLRAAAPDPNAVYSPDEHLLAVGKITHYMPPRWRDRASEPAVRREFARDYDYRFAVLLRELASIVIMPVLLVWYVPRLAEPLVHFVDVSTVNVEGIGPVCQLALFRLATAGDPLYGSPSAADAPDGALRAQDGKLEKSLLLFRANHPQWRAPAESRALVANLRQFADRRLGNNDNAADDANDDAGFDRLMEASVSLQHNHRRTAAAAAAAAAPPPRSRAAPRSADVDPMEALSDVIEQYHAERAAGAGGAVQRNRTRDDDDLIDDSADFEAGPVRPLDV